MTHLNELKMETEETPEKIQEEHQLLELARKEHKNQKNMSVDGLSKLTEVQQTTDDIMKLDKLLLYRTQNTTKTASKQVKVDRGKL